MPGHIISRPVDEARSAWPARLALMQFMVPMDSRNGPGINRASVCRHKIAVAHLMNLFFIPASGPPLSR